MTITGVGGAGKTRLALEVASRASPGYPDGVWLLDLAPVSDATVVPGELATALGLHTGALNSGPDLTEHLCEYLRARRLLLLVDNCEHVIEAAAGLVAAVMARCPDLTALATSREILGLAGEVIWPVPPLTLPPPEPGTPLDPQASDAVALFHERATAAAPAFSLSPTNTAAVVEICRRLDGIPLAIEMEAARVRVLSAAQIVVPRAALTRPARTPQGGTRNARHVGY